MMEHVWEKGSWFRVAVYVLTTIILVVVLIIPLALAPIYGPPSYTGLRSYYALFLFFLLLTFPQVSAFYLLSLMGKNLSGQFWNSPRVFIPVAVLVSFHACVIGAVFFSLLLSSTVPYLSLSDFCLSTAFSLILPIPVFIYTFSVEFLKISNGDALTVAVVTSLGTAISWFVILVLWFVPGSSMGFLLLAGVVISIYAAVLGHFALWYMRRYSEWLERGEDAPPERLIGMKDLLMLALPAAAMLTSMLWAAWTVFLR